MTVPYSPVQTPTQPLIPASSSSSVARHDRRLAPRPLLAGGVLAGPIYLGIGLAQALLRPGFDLTRHDLSLLVNGDFGWIQTANLLGSGLLVLAAALGIRRAMPGSVWGALLIGIFGLGMIGGGLFAADPALGFPPGTPADANTISWHGMLHFVCGGLGFLGLIAACFVLSARFARQHQRGLALYSIATGVVFLAGFVGIAIGSGNTWAVMGLWLGVIAAFTWLSYVSLRLLRVTN